MNIPELAVTVLGSSCSIPRPGRACSSYLIDDHGTYVVFDFGTGAFANLRSHIAYQQISAIVISHMHTDHFLDLIPLRYALRYEQPKSVGRIPVYLPPGGIAVLEDIAASLARETGDFFHDVYDLHEYDPARALTINAGIVHFCKTVHFIDAYAIRYVSKDASIVYSADTAFEMRVATFAEDADCFICEATLGPDGSEHGPVKGHISAIEAGRLAEAGRVRSLVLTHYGAGTSPDMLLAAAATEYSGEVRVADDHLQFAVRARHSSVR